MWRVLGVMFEILMNPHNYDVTNFLCNTDIYTTFLLLSILLLLLFSLISVLLMLSILLPFLLPFLLPSELRPMTSIEASNTRAPP